MGIFVRRLNIRLRGFLLFACFSLFLLFAAILNSENPNAENPNADASKFAYVFHVRNPKDLCYALANSQRVSAMIPDLNVVFIMAYKVDAAKLALPPKVIVHATPDINDGYHEAFLRFEAFGLTSYQRVIILNSNSVITAKLNKLFWLDLGGHGVAVSRAYHQRPHLNLSTALIVAQPSQQLYERVAPYQSPNEVQTVAAGAGLGEGDDSTRSKTLYEDALLNKMFDDGKKAKLLPPYSENLGVGRRELEKYKEDLSVYCYIYTNA